MKRCAIIPARGGSVRVPRKNLRPFHGKPIIAYSIETAKAAEMFDAVIVSTDDAEIAEVAESCGAVIHYRPPCDGTMGTQEVAGMVLRRFDTFDAACVIYATSPLLLPDDIRHGWRMLTEQHARFVFAVQSEPLADAGCMYWGWRGAFVAGLPLIDVRTVMLPLPADRVCDINTLADFERAERMYEQHNAMLNQRGNM